MLEILLTLALSFSLNTTPTPEPICPEIYPECYPVSVEDFAYAHLLVPIHPVESWELAAIEIISSGVRGKCLIDIVYTDCGATGIFHLQPDDPLCLGHESDYECPIRDQEWVDQVRQVLYSPYSAAIQLDAWRGRVDRAVRHAREAGCHPRELAVVASIANSVGENGTVRIGVRCDWIIEDMIEIYTNQRSESLHRARRAVRMLEHVSLRL